MAYCAMPGCKKQAVKRPYPAKRHGPVTDGPVAKVNGTIMGDVYCQEHAEDSERMFMRFKNVGIGSSNAVVLLNLDKRERPFAQS